MYGKIVFRERKYFLKEIIHTLNNFINKNSSGLYVIKVFSVILIQKRYF